MIDLTPLDVRKKRGDFKKGMRGYETQEVDGFLELVAERLEALVRENLQLRERNQSLERQVASQTEREEAVRDALVTAQELRTEIRDTARKEADKVIDDARTEARRMIAEAEAEVRTRLRNSERQADHAVETLAELERRRLRFLRSFRQLLEREMDVVEVEEGRPPLEERSFEMELGLIRGGAPRAGGRSGTSGVRYAAADDLEEGPAGEWGPPRRKAAEGGRPAAVTPAEVEDRPDADPLEHVGEAEAQGGDEPGEDDALRRAENVFLYLDDEDEDDQTERG